MTNVSSFFKKTIESTKFVRYIVEKYLLPFGSFNLSMLIGDSKLHIDPDRIKSELTYLLNEKFVTSMFSFSYDLKIDIVFYMTPELFKDFDSDLYLKNTSLVKNKYNYSKIEKARKENDTVNMEAIYTGFDAQGYDLQNTTDFSGISLDFLFDMVPFPDVPGFDDPVSTLVSDFQIPFDTVYIKSLLMLKKGELVKQGKLKSTKEALYQFLNEIKYAKLPQVILHVQGEQNFPEQTIKEVIQNSRQDIITCAITHIKKIQTTEFGQYRIVRVKDKMEVLLGNSSFSYDKVIQDDMLAAKLLKPMFEVALKLKYDLNPLKLTGEFEEQVYVVRKNRLASIIKDILARNTFLINNSEFSSLLMFYTVMRDFKSQSSLHAGVTGTPAADKNFSLGYNSFEELEKAIYHLKSIIDLKSYIDLVNERLDVFKKKNQKSGPLYKVFAFFFLRKKMIQLGREKKRYEDKAALFVSYLKA